MCAARRRPLDEYLSLEYPFDVIADPEGGYVVRFPDLPGCLTQVESLDELVPMVKDAFKLWMEAAYEEGLEIPLPSRPSEYSGAIRLRMPPSLHEELAEQAADEGVSLNTWMVTLLAKGCAEARTRRQSSRSHKSPGVSRPRVRGEWKAPKATGWLIDDDEESKAV
ncbi:MAG: type II toxin-antitoxin system HicB family antitoxin [Sphingomonadaceae bacterium]